MFVSHDFPLKGKVLRYAKPSNSRKVLNSSNDVNIVVGFS